MKYLYRNTGVIVESSKPLDSSLFIPVKEKEEKQEEVKKAPAKKTKKTEV